MLPSTISNLNDSVFDKGAHSVDLIINTNFEMTVIAVIFDIKNLSIITGKVNIIWKFKS